jgi:hypothetical protein
MDKILTRAVLVKVSISQFNPKRQDGKTTAEVLADKGAKSTAGVWIKNLVDPKALEAINTLAQAARAEHYRLSLPWADEGWRILPTAIYMKYQEAMREKRTGFSWEVQKFLDKYPQYIEEAKAALNGMFNPGDYPTPEQVKGKFGMKIDVAPLPCGSDFRVSLGSDELAAMQQDVDQRVKEATAQAVKDLWNRLAQPVKAMVNRLSEPDSIFRDSLIDNLRDIIDLVPSLNVTGDPALDAVAQECKVKLSGFKAEDLRKDKALRKSAAEEADAILKKMEGYI